VRRFVKISLGALAVFAAVMAWSVWRNHSRKRGTPASSRSAPRIAFPGFEATDPSTT
jgi:hypothetical protein